MSRRRTTETSPPPTAHSFRRCTIADTFTPNLNLTQPEVGASDDSWGTKLNADLATLDALFALSGVGTVVTRDTNNNANTSGVVVAKAAGNSRWVQWLSTTSLRWLMGANSVAEGGSNAGSDFNLQRYADNGTTLLGTSIAIARATGQATFETTPQVGSNAILHLGNINTAIGNNLGSVSPGIGEIRMWSGSADPSGGFWMICDGRAISRTTYATLFALIGTTYGAGDGTTTFNIQNFSERVPVGKAAVAHTLIAGYDASVLGAAVGEGQHALTIAELAQHTHGVTDPGHVHGPGSGSHFLTDASGNQLLNSANPGAAPAATTASATTGISINNTGSGTAHNTVQPGLVVNFVIRVQ